MATIRSMTALEVRDPEASLAFYQRLGFGTLGIWEPGEVGTIIVQRGEVTLLLQRALKPAVNSGMATYIYVDDADILHAEFRDAGIEILSPDVQDAFYGCREFEVIDPDGHHIIFGKDMNPSPYGNGLGTDQGRG